MIVGRKEVVGEVRLPGRRGAVGRVEERLRREVVVVRRGRYRDVVRDRDEERAAVADRLSRRDHELPADAPERGVLPVHRDRPDARRPRSRGRSARAAVSPAPPSSRCRRSAASAPTSRSGGRRRSAERRSRRFQGRGTGGRRAPESRATDQRRRARAQRRRRAPRTPTATTASSRQPYANFARHRRRSLTPPLPRRPLPRCRPDS